MQRLQDTAVAVKRLVPHLLCFVFPLTTFVYVAGAPNSWWVSVLALVMIALICALDMFAGAERRQPHEGGANWVFDAPLYLLALVQLANITALVWMISVVGFFSLDGFVGWFLVGLSSGYSAIVTAHELIHRPEAHRRWLGRMLLTTVLYDHFYTEHIRGHHRLVATGKDPATARYREGFRPFFRRTVKQQFLSAWALEARRLKNPKWWQPRMLRNRVLHGVVFEWSIALGLGVVFGPGVYAAYVMQALLAVLLLEGVNYIEHWGLVRRGKFAGTMDSWDTDSWLTYYTLVGLSRHADHHAYATRPYQDLRYVEESPKLPFGYWGSVVSAFMRNGWFRHLLKKELRARRLGPFFIEDEDEREDEKISSNEIEPELVGV